MAKAILTFPEGILPEVIKVVRAGLHQVEWGMDKEIVEGLRKWCREQEDYIHRDER